MDTDQPKFLFGDIVVVKENLIGVIVKTFERVTGDSDRYHYYVYVRSLNGIEDLDESIIDRYRVRHKELNNEELMFQYNT